MDRDSSASELLRALLAESGPLANEMVGRVREEIPSFAAVPRDEQLADTVATVEWLARVALERPQPRPDLERIEALGARRAEQGIPVDDLVRSWRLAVRMGTERARRLAERLELPPELVLEVFESTLRATDEALVPLVGSHREASGSSVESRGRFLVAALTGELGRGELRSRAAAHGLDPTRSYRAFRIPLERGTVAEPALDPGTGLWSRREDELIGAVAGEIGRGGAGLVAVGPSVPVDELPRSFAVAGRVLSAARSFGLAGVHDLTSAAAFVIAVESGDAGDALTDRYVRPLSSAASGEDLIATVRAWQETGMRVDAAAERLHIHPNTLRYRLRRYEELTGADLSDTEDIVSVWIALSRRIARGR